MGKKQHSKDRLFITQTEHKYLYGGKKEQIRRAYKRLPFDCCSITLSPFKNPVCTRAGHVFDLESIVPYLQERKVNPVDGTPLTMKDLIKLNYSKNADGKYYCPVTFKAFTNNSKIAAISTTGNVFSYSAIEELNIKGKNWTDLLSGEKFKRRDVIILQDPQDLTNREIGNFEHLRLAAASAASSSSVVRDELLMMYSSNLRICWCIGFRQKDSLNRGYGTNYARNPSEKRTETKTPRRSKENR